MFKFGRLFGISKNIKKSSLSLNKVLIRNASKTSACSSLGRPGLTVIFNKKYLLATNIISSGVLMFIGDLAQQEIEFRQEILEARYDYGRLTRMFLVGLVLGPIHHYYYVWIAKKWPQRTTKIITWKILLDQFVMSPICIAAFFYGLCALEMKNVVQATNELWEKFVTIYTADWCVWPPTQFINFYYIPVKYQVLYINAITMLYNVFLSYIKHKKVEEIQATEI